jgi:glycosyltransferase involved in cell wall biosynthesis
MKILFLSTTDIEGGAAIASFRLFQALKKSGLDVKMLVGQKLSDDKDVVEIWKSNIKKYISCGLHISEKLKLLMNINNRKDIFFFSTGEFGTDISKHPLVQEADVIHYHWINHTFLSLKNLEKILATGKQVISHLHDMWAFTGGCHYAGECENFIKSCGNCPMLSSPSSNDISFQIHVMKQKLYNAPNLSFITSSVYLKNIAEKSSLLKNKEITALPIPIDTDFYKRTNFICARKKFNLSLDKSILLFGAHNISHSRKGFKYFIEAVNKLESENRDFSKNVEVAVFGKCKENLQNYFKVKVNRSIEFRAD